ncbi:hypothetical protein IWZ03DRAFT_441061 [Phyllosticta citriasiana]|uniref:SNF2 N-terminal domain-containing protein n=1 Tax=Phyllosticta citriasiana TaxID=595635 RepID=A0ABR1KQ83_9PEZI
MFDIVRLLNPGGLVADGAFKRSVVFPPAEWSLLSFFLFAPSRCLNTLLHPVNLDSCSILDRILLDNLENDGRDDDNDDNNGKDTRTEIAKTGNTLLVVFADGSELTTGRSYEVEEALAGTAHTVTSDAVIHGSFADRSTFFDLNAATRRILAVGCVPTEESDDTLLLAQHHGYDNCQGDLGQAMNIPRLKRERSSKLLEEISDDAFKRGLLPISPAFLRTRENLPSKPDEIYQLGAQDQSETESFELPPDDLLEAKQTDDSDNLELPDDSDLRARRSEHHSVLEEFSYEQACGRFHGITAESPQRQTGFSLDPFEPTPTPIISVEWLSRMRHNTKLNGAILGLGTGCGRTACSLAFLEAEVKRVLDANVAPFKPHLIVCPASLMPNWISDFYNHFSKSGLLKMWALESSEKAALAQYTWSGKQLVAAKYAVDTPREQSFTITGALQEHSRS